MRQYGLTNFFEQYGYELLDASSLKQLKDLYQISSIEDIKADALELCWGTTMGEALNELQNAAYELDTDSDRAIDSITVLKEALIQGMIKKFEELAQKR